MKYKIYVLIYMLLLVGCTDGKNNSVKNSLTNTNSNELVGPLCVADFIDGKRLDPAPSFPDTFTKHAIAAVNATKSKAPKLAVGVSNRHLEVKRLASECADWMVLDIDGVENGPAFFHVDLSDQQALEELSTELPGKFSRIDFDYSVTRLANGFSYDSLLLFLAMVKKGGTLNIWPDERPFQEPVQTIENGQFKTTKQFVADRIAILKRAQALPQLPEAFLVSAGYDTFSYSFAPDIDAQDVTRIKTVIAEHQQLKWDVLKKFFAQKGFHMELKSGGFPLPRGGFDYTSLEYLAITKL